MIQIKTWPTLPKTHTALTNDGWETTCLGALFVSGRVLSITHTLNDDPHIWSLSSPLKYPEWIWMRTHSLANTHVSWVVPGIFPLHRWLIGISVQTTWWSISPLGSFMPRNYHLQIIKYPQKAVWRILDKCQSLWTKFWAIIIQLSSTLLHLWPSSGWPRWRLCNDLVDLGLGGQRRGVAKVQGRRLMGLELSESTRFIQVYSCPLTSNTHQVKLLTTQSEGGVLIFI